MPFVIVHVHAVLLLINSLAATMVLSCYVGQAVTAALASSAVVSGFYALWHAANLLEEPFAVGLQNEVPLMRYHEEFIAALASSVRTPWMQTVCGAWRPRALNNECGDPMPSRSM